VQALQKLRVVDHCINGDVRRYVLIWPSATANGLRAMQTHTGAGLVLDLPTLLKRRMVGDS
jgi:hypothetical protein